MLILPWWRHITLALVVFLLVGCASAAEPVVSTPPTAVALAESTSAPTSTLQPTATVASTTTSTATTSPTETPTTEPSPTTESLPTSEPSATAAPTASSTPVGPTAIVHAVTPVAPDAPFPTAEPTPADEPEQPTDVQAPPTAALSYVFPLDPPTLGDYGSCHHDYPASDIFTPRGTRFVAVTGGVVEFVSRADNWNPAADDPAERGGISVSVVGDDAVRYYGSHLQSVADGIEVGMRVETGQLLGLTGASGNARSTPPHLHFGISHPTGADDWQTRRGEINPVPYLRAWRQGEKRTPDLDVVGGGAC